MKKPIRRLAAITVLKTFFTHTDEDTLTPDQIYERAGRNPTNSEQNKSWLTNRLTPLRYYKLVESVYTKDKPIRLDKIRLTLEGKRALEDSRVKEVTREISLESIAQDIREFEKRNPSVVLELSVTVRKNMD